MSVKKISLTVKTIQKPTGELPLDMEFITIGTLYEKNDATYIIYEEAETTGLKGHKTTLIISPNEVKMNRFGEHPINMIFAQGLRQVTAYHTPYGKIRLEYLTHKLAVELNDTAGKIIIHYDMSLKDLQEASNILEITFKIL